jgi:SET domain
MPSASWATWGSAAALMQIVGYGLYIRSFMNHTIRPNAASWFMFAYGTAFLGFLEYRSGAGLGLLLLPAACATMSIAVALLCLRRGATAPVDRFEKIVFSADLWLTVVYGAVTLGYGSAALSSGFVTIILAAVNLTAVTCFLPTIRSTWKSPDRELPLPWLVWALAYGVLSVATWKASGLEQPSLLLYPLLNCALHGLVGLFALRAGSLERTYVDPARTIYIARSGIHGRGVFSGKGFSKGDVVWKMSGRPVFKSSADSEPNFVGIAPGFWINPDAPIDTMNHSCAPNATFDSNFELIALETIHAHDEVTFDYSTTEADPKWQMACACGAPTCRQTLFAIQYAFANANFPPPASPTMQQVWRAHRRGALAGSAFPHFSQADSPAELLAFPEPKSADQTG